MSLHKKNRLSLRCAQLESRLVCDASGHLASAPFPCGAAELDQGLVRILPGDPSQEASGLTHHIEGCCSGDGTTLQDGAALSASLVDQAFTFPNAGAADFSPHNLSIDSENNPPVSAATWTELGERQTGARDDTWVIIEERAFSTPDTACDRPLWEQACAYVLKQAAAHRTLRYHQDLHGDLVQEVYLDWYRCQKRAGKPTDSPPLLTRGSPERIDFQRAVERVFGRARTQLKRQPHLWEMGQQPAPGGGAHEHDWEKVERALTNALATLSPEQRRVVEMFEEGQTFEDIGQALGCSKQRAWRVWDHAYTHVRACLEQTSE